MTTVDGRPVHAFAAALLALTVAACGPSDRSRDGGAPVAGDETSYDCFGVTTTASQLRQAPTVAELGDHPAAQAFAEHADHLDEWRAVVVEDDELAAIRELRPPDVQGGEVRDHERKAVTLLDEPAPPETDEDGWLLSSSGPCALRAELGGLEPATVHRHADAPIDEGTSVLDLLVVEQGCASGRGAAGRIQLSVDRREEEIRLVAGVAPRRGDQSCPANPATPVTVDLDEPVGDRVVVDAGRYPPLELTPLEPEPANSGS